MEEVTITINPEGGAVVSVGCAVKGKSCKEITKAIEQALGKTVGDVETPEMREVARATHRH